MKFQIILDDFADLIEELDKMEQDTKKPVDEALKETGRIVQNNLEQAAIPYKGKGRRGYGKGAMYNSIITDPKVEWEGSVAGVGVGFDKEKDEAGFYHSIFILHGTPRHPVNHPGTKPDRAVYNAIFGSKTRKEIEKAQREIMERYIEKGR